MTNNAICTKCNQVFSVTQSYHPDHGAATVANGHCLCPDWGMGAVIWSNAFNREGIRKATDEEVKAHWAKVEADLTQKAQERWEVATEAALPALMEYLEENSPQTILFFKREWRRNARTHRKMLHKAALAVSEDDGNIRPEMLKELFEQALGYR